MELLLEGFLFGLGLCLSIVAVIVVAMLIFLFGMFIAYLSGKKKPNDKRKEGRQ